MRVPRIIAITAAAGLAVFGLAYAAPALAQASTSGGLGPRVHAVNLHTAYEAHLGHTKAGKIAGIVYARGKQPKAANVKASCTEPNCPLVYNGGPVQHSPHFYLLFWGPTWSTDSGEEASASYLENLCNGLGVQPQDTWSTINDQYTDSTGHPSFSGSVCMGFFQDTSTPPTGVDQSQLAAEADAFASAHGITDTTNAQIVIATQSGTCPAGFYAPGCNGGSGTYCAWHSNSNEPYTNLPYILDAGSGCGEDFVNAGGTYDGFSIVEGHEYAETITDPFPTSGWWDSSDSSGGEIGDKCAWNALSSDVTLSTGSFAMQPLYSNAGFTSNGRGCVMSMPQSGGVTLTVTKSGTGAASGTVTSSPSGISCGGTCSSSFVPGTTVTLTATPATGEVFTGWSGTPSCTGMASNTCTLTLSANTTVKASFTASAKLYQQTSATYSGTWGTSTCTCYSGGSDAKTTAAGASAKFKFTGNLIQFVSVKGTSHGSFKVYIDGVYKTTVSTYITTANQNAVIVWQKSFSSVGTHTLKIVNVATSGHPRVDADAFVVAT
jgi:Divergent InlB B-repeat domain